jgi:hypothetical protein
MVDEIEQRLSEMPSEDREDKLTNDIEALIRAEGDVHFRGLLMAMQKMNSNIITDARLTRLLAQRLMTFNKDYNERSVADMKILHQGIGGWKAFLIVGIGIGGLLISVSIFLVNRAVQNMDAAAKDRALLQKEVIQQKGTDAALDSRLQHLEELIIRQHPELHPSAPAKREKEEKGK